MQWLPSEKHSRVINTDCFCDHIEIDTPLKIIEVCFGSQETS